MERAIMCASLRSDVVGPTRFLPLPLFPVPLRDLNLGGVDLECQEPVCFEWEEHGRTFAFLRKRKDCRTDLGMRTERDKNRTVRIMGLCLIFDDKLVIGL